MSGAPTLRVAYADPPYLGCGRRYPEHPEAREWDRPERHAELVAQLVAEFPDGWAMSASSPSLRHILPACPADVRVAAWVKPFVAFKPNVAPVYSWEPVIFRGGRRNAAVPRRAARDSLAASIALKRGTVGAKPAPFCSWLFDLLGLLPGDELADLFPGSGAVAAAWSAFQEAPAP